VIYVETSSAPRGPGGLLNPSHPLGDVTFELKLKVNKLSNREREHSSRLG